MARSTRLWLVCFSALFLSSVPLRAADVIPTRSAKNGSTVAVNSAAAKSLSPILKPIAEPLRLKLLAGVDASSLNDAAVVEILGRYADREAIAGRFSPSLIRTVRLLGQSEHPTSVAKVVSLLSSNDSRVAMLAADMVSTSKRETALVPLLKLADRRDYPLQYGLRRCVVDAVACYPHKSAIDFLITTVIESRGQLKYETVRHLTRITGQNFGGNADNWKAWWHEHRDTFDFTTTNSDSTTTVNSANLLPIPNRILWPEPVPEFFGVPIYAQRICFVLDRSSSMASSINGELRLDRAVKELEQAILALSDQARFNIVAFSNETKPFRRELILATPEGKRQGIGFAISLAPEDMTNCYDALSIGLDSDPNLEAMLFLSDGEPTAGPIVEPTAIIEAISARNTIQRTSINTIGIDARGTHEEFLKLLASGNFGSYKSIR